jgi:hypothetical protein
MTRKQDLRNAVEHQLGDLVSDSAFSWLCEEIIGNPEEHAFGDELERMSPKRLSQTADDMVSEYKRARRFGLFRDPDAVRPVVAVEPPDWWAHESDLVLESLLSEQDEALRLFGLRNPLPMADLPVLIKEWAAEERIEGDHAVLPYPVPSKRDRDTILVAEQLIFRGVHTDEFVKRGGRGRLLPWHSLSEMTDEAMRGADKALAWAESGEQRLWRLHQQAIQIHRRAGFGIDQAVGFLLCDLRQARPWVNIQAGQFNERWFFKIAVGTPDVSPDVLAAAYGRYLEEQGLRQPTRRTGRDSRSILYEWVMETRRADPSLGFPELYARWSRLLAAGDLPAGAVSYARFESMRSAYGQKSRELRAKAGGASAGQEE